MLKYGRNTLLKADELNVGIIPAQIRPLLFKTNEIPCHGALHLLHNALSSFLIPIILQWLHRQNTRFSGLIPLLLLLSCKKIRWREVGCLSTGLADNSIMQLYLLILISMPYPIPFLNLISFHKNNNMTTLTNYKWFYTFPKLLDSLNLKRMGF